MSRLPGISLCSRAIRQVRQLRVLLVGLLLSLAAQAPLAALESPDFVVKPYVQLGSHPSGQSLEIIWFSHSEEQYKLSYWIDLPGKPPVDRTTVRTKSKRMGQIGREPYFKYVASLDSLPYGKSISYQVENSKGEPLFKASTVTRKSRQQPYTFAVFGDVGARSSGQRQVVYRCYEKKPDFIVIPGDVAYDRGLVSDYIKRYFPILNSDSASPETGAPLIRSCPSVASLGNHDVALTLRWDGTDFTMFPDALGYFIFFSQPLNGPNKIPNSKNTTRITGDAENQLNFIRAAGPTFPVMANFSFDYGNSHWLVLDSNEYMDWTDRRMRSWVEDDLRKARNATWRFVCFHHPGFTADSVHHLEQRMRLLADIFERQKVTLVFSGHAHTYQRSFPLKFKCKKREGKLVLNDDDTVDGDFILDKKFDGKQDTTPDGVIYLVSGGGGALLYEHAEVSDQWVDFTDKYIADQHSFTICSVKGDTVKVTQISADGDTLDTFTVSAAEPVEAIKGVPDGEK